MVSLQFNDSHLSSQNIEKHSSLIIYSMSRRVQIQMPEIFLELFLTKKLMLSLITPTF